MQSAADNCKTPIRRFDSGPRLYTGLERLVTGVPGR